MDRNYYVITFISKYRCFKKAWGSHFCCHHQIITMFIKKSLKTQENLKELEIIKVQSISVFLDITIICWFPVKKCWCHQNSGDVLRGPYLFRSSLGKVIPVPSFIIVGYVWYILSPIREQPRKCPSWIGLKQE